MGDEILQPGVSIKPKVNEEDVKRLAEELYGLKCEHIKELNGYDDKNYHILVESKSSNVNIPSISSNGYTLKIINSLDSKKSELFEAQSQLLLHLGKKDICCPKPVKNLNNCYFSTEKLSSGNHIVRLLEYIPGLILHQVPISDDLAFRCGKYAAELNEALQDFHHPIYDSHKTLWMLDQVPELETFLFAIKDEKKQNLVKRIIHQFEDRVLKHRNTFEKAMIHGDFNEQNIIVEKVGESNFKIKGILDFGDTNFSCVLYELAIATAYMTLHGKDLNIGGYFVAGFTSIKNLPEKEFNLLKVCISARICQSLVLGAYTHLEDPSNTYVLITAKIGWKILEDLESYTDEELYSKWNEIKKRVLDLSLK